MSRIHSTTVQREFELCVDYIEDPADKSTGHPDSVEILSVKIGDVKIPLTKEQWESIEDEVKDQVYA